jgi:hypothetical protein
MKGVRIVMSAGYKEYPITPPQPWISFIRREAWGKASDENVALRAARKYRPRARNFVFIHEQIHLDYQKGTASIVWDYKVELNKPKKR